MTIGEQLGLNAINWSGMLSTTMYWLTYIVVAILLGAFFTVLSIILSYKIKVDVYRLCGSGKDGMYSIGKRTTNRLKKVDGGRAWKALWPLFNRKKISPFDSDYIYSGNRVYAFILNDEWIPGRINVNQDKNKLSVELITVPNHIRDWQSLQHKKNNLEFAEHNWWADNKLIVCTIIAVAVCCAMAVVTVWLSYKFAAGGKEAAASLTEAIKNIGIIQGIG